MTPFLTKHPSFKTHLFSILIKHQSILRLKLFMQLQSIIVKTRKQWCSKIVWLLPGNGSELPDLRIHAQSICSIVIFSHSFISFGSLLCCGCIQKQVFNLMALWLQEKKQPQGCIIFLCSCPAILWASWNKEKKLAELFFALPQWTALWQG